MNNIIYEGTTIYWIAVDNGSHKAHGELNTSPSVVTSKWDLEAYTDRNIWTARLINDFGIDPDADETP